MIRFLWIASRGYRLRPWASPYLRWRIETYSGIKADSLTFQDFWNFVWTRRASRWRYLRWTSRMNASL
jgi:hypothetical protein